MIYYIDTSALVKRYFEEPGTENINRLLAREGIHSTSLLTYAEMLSVFARKHKARDLSTPDYRKAVRQFETEWKSLHVISLNYDMLTAIRGVVTKHHLRGADGVHLASALYLAHNIRDEVMMIASDNELLNAAKKAKLQVMNPAAN